MEDLIDRGKAKHLEAEKQVFPEQQGLRNYGIIGNCEASALVSRGGSIDWLCLPRFDSSSVFARILDAGKGGHFSISPSRFARSSQSYLGDTNILQTDFFDEVDTHLRVTDFIPILTDSLGISRIVRIVELLNGSECLVDVECFPRFDYGRVKPRINTAEHDRVSFENIAECYRLESSIPVTWIERDAGVLGTLTIEAHNKVVLVFGKAELKDNERNSTLDEMTLSSLEATREFWLQWVSTIPATHDYQKDLRRSGLALKLLTHGSTGGLIASPTTSLPEEIGGVRNWDYRYVWLRDATFVVDAFYQLGHAKDGRRFLHWMKEKARIGTEPLQVAYAIDGAREAPEFILKHLRGHRDSRPVRVGNAAFDQVQLDVYGEVVNCMDNCRVHGDPNAVELWKRMESLLEWICEHWREPDTGIWEMRGEPRHFVYSKVMAWVAVDRAIGGADSIGASSATLSRWEAVRDEIKQEIYSKGWSEELGSFVQSYGARALDAANLRFPLVGFISAHDPKMKSTIAAVRKHLSENDLVFRYRDVDDGVIGGEATFSICTLWLVQNLILLGEMIEAERILCKILRMGGQLGLFSEEIDPSTGELLGNYPQSFTHVGIINSIVLLERNKRGLPCDSMGRGHFVPEPRQ